MNARTRQYLFALVFMGVGAYQLYRQDYVEASLYFLAGLAFLFNTLTSEPRLFQYKKTLVAVTWVLIVVTGLAFLYLMQFKYF